MEPQPTPFAEWLRKELDIRGWGLRPLARLMNPEHPGNAKRALNRWLKGTQPSEESIQAVADALGIPRDQIPAGGDGRSASPFAREMARMLDALYRRAVEEAKRELRDEVTA